MAGILVVASNADAPAPVLGEAQKGGVSMATADDRVTGLDATTSPPTT